MALNLLPQAGSPADDSRVLSWRDIAAPLPEIEWLNEPLKLAAGRPYVLCGEAGAKKSWFGQACLIQSVVGLPMLGTMGWRSAPIRALHVDYEQGERESRRRFQVLATALQCGQLLLRSPDSLGYVFQPIETWKPDSEPGRVRAYDALCRLAAGYDFVLVDSLIDCQPGAEENSAEISAALKLSTKVSEATGAAFMFLDHASNKSSDAKRGNAQRGHTSKKGASSVLLVATGDGKGPVHVTCERCQVAPHSAWPSEFYFDLLSTPNGGTAVVGAAAPEETTANEELDRVCLLLLKSVKDNEGLSFNELFRLVGGHRSDVAAARDRLVREGAIVNRGTVGQPSWCTSKEEAPF